MMKNKPIPNFFHVNRELLNSDRWLSEPFTRGQAWVDIFGLAQHTPSFIRVRGIKVDIKRGQLGYSQVTLSKRWKWSRNKVRRYLEELEKNGDIEQENTGVTTLITVKKYDIWQGDGTANETAEGQQKDSKRNTYNKDNNVKKQDSVEILKNSIPGITTGDDYEADNDSPLDKIKIKRQLEKSLGLKKSSKWGEFIYGTGNDFLKAYEYFTGEKYEGNVILDEVAKNLASWYARGETRDTIQDMITKFFGSEKAKKITVTPKSVFSDHTYNSWKQKKL